MNKGKFFLLYLFGSWSFFLSAQTVEKGNIIIESYAGFVSLGNVAWEKYAEDNSYNVEADFQTPWGVRAEYAVHNRFSAGLEYNNTQRELSWNKDDTTGVAPLEITPFRYTIKQQIHRFMPRITAHLSNNEKLDIYIGFGLGLRIAKYDTEVTPDKPSWEFNWPGFNPVATRIAFGVKFYPVKPVGIFLEMGTPGGNLFHGGLSLKF